MKSEEQNSNTEKESVFVRKVWLSPIFYVYFLSVLLALGMLYIHRENMINRNSIPRDMAVDSIYDSPIKENVLSSEKTFERIDLSTVLNPTKSQMTRGYQLFKFNCSSCHGIDGKGDGPASASLNPKPRDYGATTGWVNGRLLSDMFKTVSEGIPKSAMVSFAGVLSISDRLDIIDYIRSNFGTFPKDDPEQLETMEKKYNFEEVGGKFAFPEEIPVSEAMKQIEEEGINSAKNISSIMSEISQHPADQGSLIFKNVTIDENRALTMLDVSDFWTKNESDFVMLVTADEVQNGFDPIVAQLSAQDWITLYNYLKDLFSMKNSRDKNG